MHGGEGIPPGRYPRPRPHHTEGHHPPTFSTISVHGKSSVRGHYMWVHVLMEPTPGPQLATAVVPTVPYGELHRGSSRVPICLCNLCTQSIKIPTKTVAGQVIPANQVPLVVLIKQGLKRNPIAIQKRDGSWGCWSSQASGSGPKLNRNRPENCCSNGKHLFACSTWTWVKLLRSNIKLR